MSFLLPAGMICHICGSGNPKPASDHRGRVFWFCPLCGFVSLAPSSRMSEEAEGERYLLHKNDPQDPEYRSRRYGGIILLEVIEHLTNPYLTMKDLANLLPPGGRFFLKTGIRPDSTEEFLSWWYKEDPTHISFFEIRSMEVLSARISCACRKTDKKGELVLVKDRV